MEIIWWNNAIPKVVLVSLLSLVLVLSAAGLECRIYVSSSDGINNTSCWTGGLQTPCATIDLAIQGTPTLQYNCSSAILINLSPGTYTLDTTSLLEQQLLRNNVSIIGMRDGSRYEEVSITCLNVSSSSYNWLRYIAFQRVSFYYCNNVSVTCTEPSFDLTTHNELAQEICHNLTLNIEFINPTVQCYNHSINSYPRTAHSSSCDCEYLQFNVSIIDNCITQDYQWKNDMRICPNSLCSTEKIVSSQNGLYNQSLQCFDNSIEAGPIETTVYIETLGLISINTTVTVNVSATCASEHHFVNGECTNIQICNDAFEYNLPFLYYYYERTYYESIHNDANIYYYYFYLNYKSYHRYAKKCAVCFGECCYDISTDQCLSICSSDTGVPINNLTCINCTQYSKYGIILFIGLELIPMTLMVIVIIIFNIQLTNGSINVVVFYSQLIAIIQSINGLTSPLGTFSTIFQHLSAIPCYIFNLDFTPFLFNYPLCISDHMSPLGAISFWYVIGFYPLLLLLLLYIWMTLYDKGFKCVVFITRPFHRCMARFWSMTGIEPSFTHSIASIYILCFTQLTATSFKILSLNVINNDNTFFFDEKQGYFQGWHGLAGFIAIIVLLFLIILPTLCILFYPFKWFQKLLDCLHLRKPLLITLADVFTGPYKNGTENTFDYRFMAGLYLLARIIILSQFIIGYKQHFSTAIPIAQIFFSFLLAAIILIFRPFQRNIHSFIEFIGAIPIIIVLITLLITFTVTSSFIYLYYVFTIIVMIFNIIIFGIIIPIYIINKSCKVIEVCHYYHKKKVSVVPTVQEYDENATSLEDNRVADRMENPQDYDERHVPLKPYDLVPMNEQPSVAAAVEELKETTT